MAASKIYNEVLKGGMIDKTDVYEAAVREFWLNLSIWV